MWLECCLKIIGDNLGYDYGNTESMNDFAQNVVHVSEIARLACESLVKMKASSDKYKIVSPILTKIGEGYRRSGNNAGAMFWYKMALTTGEKAHGKNTPSVASTYHNMAMAYNSQGNYAKALEWYKKALVIKEPLLGSSHHDVIAIYNGMAQVYCARGEYHTALELYGKLMLSHEASVGLQHETTAHTYQGIADVHMCQSDYSNALIWYRKALTIFEKIHKDEHPDLATVYSSIATAYKKKRDDYQYSLDLYGQALKINEVLFGRGSLNVANDYRNIAEVHSYMADSYQALKNLSVASIKYNAAVESYLKALDIYEKILGIFHSEVIDIKRSIASVYKNRKDFKQAAKWYLKCIKTLRATSKDFRDKWKLITKDLEICYRAMKHDEPSKYPKPFNTWLSESKESN
jgi:pentatricopeptide repeat protein